MQFTQSYGYNISSTLHSKKKKIMSTRRAYIFLDAYVCALNESVLDKIFFFFPLLHWSIINFKRQRGHGNRRKQYLSKHKSLSRVNFGITRLLSGSRDDDSSSYNLTNQRLTEGVGQEDSWSRSNLISFIFIGIISTYTIFFPMCARWNHDYDNNCHTAASTSRDEMFRGCSMEIQLKKS